MAEGNESEIVRGFDRLENVVKEVELGINSLSVRLVPVMRQIEREPPSPEAENKPETIEAFSPVGKQLTSVRHQLEDIRNSIGGIAELLQI